MKEWVRKAQRGDGDAFILDISTLYGHSKVDAPLEIQGNWEIPLQD